jgi:hypothetical protein
MAQGVMRPRKGGGYSKCTAPPDKVGKGRCVHIGGTTECFPTNTDRGATIIDISKYQGKSSPETIKAQMKEMSSALTETQKQRLVASFRGM